jgi:DNA gyrase inhibitor GyrI
MATAEGLAIAGSALVLKPMSRLSCARFIHKGPVHALSLTLGYIYHTWLPKSRVRPSHPWIIEHYGHHPPLAVDPSAIIEIDLPITARG